MIAQNAPQSQSLVLCTISGGDNLISLSSHADMVRITQKQPKQQPRRNLPKRGSVSIFSRRSRKRMIEHLSMKRDLLRPIFITLTLPDEVWFDRHWTGRDLERCRQLFVRRLEHEFSGVGLVWRKEYAERKSGRFSGEICPHLHILADGIMSDLADLRRWCWRVWHEVLTDGRCDLPKRPRIDVSPARNKRHAYYYVSKYTAKLDNEESVCEFFHNHAGEVGRHWGKRGAWDMSAVFTVRLTHEQFIQLRRLAASWLKRRNMRYARRLMRQNPDVGFSLFGLGDQSCGVWRDFWDSTLVKMVLHAQELAIR